MSNDKGPFSILKKLFQKNDDTQKFDKKHYIIIVFVIGIAIMLFSNFFSSQRNESSNPVPVTSDSKEAENAEVFGNSGKNQPSTMKDYEEYYENQLKEAIESIVGVDDVSIVVNVDSTEKVVYEKNMIKKSK